MGGAAGLSEVPALDPDQQSRMEAQQRQQEAVFHKDRVGLDVFDLFSTVQLNIPPELGPFVVRRLHFLSFRYIFSMLLL